VEVLRKPRAPRLLIMLMTNSRALNVLVRGTTGLTFVATGWLVATRLIGDF
jgi:hypothetical protein